MESDQSIHAQLKYGHALVRVNTSLKSINYVTEQQNMVIINKCISISDVLRDRDKQLWEKITDTQCCLKDFLPSKRTDRSRQRGHDYILPRIRTERFKRCFVNRCLFNFFSLTIVRKLNCILINNFSFFTLYTCTCAC